MSSLSLAEIAFANGESHWTSSKLDEVVLRDRDFSQAWGAAGDGTCEQRTYYAQNWRGDVVATLDSTGARRETIRYSTYGVPFGMAASDVNGSGTITIGDRNAVNAQIGKSYGQAGYTVLLDIDLDGDVDINDWNIANGQFGVNLGHGVLSFDVTSANGGNRIGYAGYAWEPATSKYHVRHRVLDPLRGRWSRRDPLGYVDSPTLYSYVNNEAMAAIDPTGLASLKCAKGCTPAQGWEALDPDDNAQLGGGSPTVPNCSDVTSDPPGYEWICQAWCKATNELGVTVCVGTAVVACVFRSQVKTLTATFPQSQIIERCVGAHEKQHTKQRACLPGQPPYYPSVPYFFPRYETKSARECEAYKEELACLATSLWIGECNVGGSLNNYDLCEFQIKTRMWYVCSQITKYCGTPCP